jgi:UDP-2-acetamido-3-amino-2,3-dideoxy-glucuronate N-acetyltransferase
MENDSIKVAVIGCGYWGRNLVRNYAELGVLGAVCDKDDALLASIRARYPDVETCLAVQDVLNSDRIDCVAVATPAETHYDLVRRALLAGKDVYVEKPLVLDESEADELIELAESRRLTLMVGHLLHYHPVFERLKNLVLNGELGRIDYIYSHRLNLGKIRREENILWSFAPHDVSMILALAGEMPDNIAATGGCYLHRTIADVTTTHIEFPSGLRAHIFVSWLHPFKEQKLVIVGNRKMAVFDDGRLWNRKLILYPHSINWKNYSPVPCRAEPEYVTDIPELEPLGAECRHFLACVRDGVKPVTDGQEGLQVLRVLKAAQESLNRNGRKIYFQTPPVKEGKRLSRNPHYSGPEQNEPYYTHASAVIDATASIGRGTKIWHFSHVQQGAKIGTNCNIGQNVVIGPGVTIGNDCKIQNNVSVYQGVSLEDGVFCGPSAVFTNVYNPRAELKKMDEARPTLVQQGATIGANATIVCGHTLGRYSFVGAGSVVTRDIPDYALVVGNPARQIGWACRCGERLPEDLQCSKCRQEYILNGEWLLEKPDMEQMNTVALGATIAERSPALPEPSLPAGAL